MGSRRKDIREIEIELSRDEVDHHLHLNVVYLTSWFVTGKVALELDSFLTRIFSAGPDRFGGADEAFE